MCISLLSSACAQKGGETPQAASRAESFAEQSEAAESVYEKKPEEYGKVIALTFDDGPNTTTTVRVLDKLEEYGVKASFFLIGDNITPESAEVVKRAHDMGCEIDNHSRTHSYMTKMTPQEIAAEFEYTSDRIKEITGESPKFFRPPYIDVNSDMFENIGVPFISGYGCNDYDAKVQIEERAQRTLEQAKDGAIILLHDSEGNIKTVAALDIIIPELQKQGYEFVTVSELFYAKGEQPSADEEIVYSYTGQTSMYG